LVFRKTTTTVIMFQARDYIHSTHSFDLFGLFLSNGRSNRERELGRLFFRHGR
jgi:hypothetical protein